MIIPFVVNFDYDNLVYCYVLLGLITYLNYFVVMVANVFNIPIEKCVYLYYKFNIVVCLLQYLQLKGKYG